MGTEGHLFRLGAPTVRSCGNGKGEQSMNHVRRTRHAASSSADAVGMWNSTIQPKTKGKAVRSERRPPHPRANPTYAGTLHAVRHFPGLMPRETQIEIASDLVPPITVGRLFAPSATPTATHT